MPFYGLALSSLVLQVFSGSQQKSVRNIAMLQAMYNVIDRRRRPLRHHHYMVFSEAQMAYARVPGAPMAAVRPYLRYLCDRNELGSATPESSDIPSPDTGLWESDPDLLTARELKMRHPDFSVFAVVQSPHGRIAWCYDNLILGSTALPAFFEENGFSKDMTRTDFIDRAVQIDDLRADNLLRSQESILCHKGKLVPDLVLDLDNLAADWGKLQSLVKRQSGRDLGTGPDATPPITTNTHRAVTDRHAADLLQRRYRRDYALFFGKPGPRRLQELSRPRNPVLEPQIPAKDGATSFSPTKS